VGNPVTTGPGVIDMKGGITVLLFTLMMLDDLGLRCPSGYHIFFSADEETGSEDARPLVEAQAQGKDYGGCNVYIGAEVDSDEWDDVIEKALKGDGVIQHKVAIPEEPFPVITDGGLTFENRKVNINPFALGGSYGGCVSRLSTESIINVRAGGGAVPLFVVEA
jgi:hypothetical protein